jgi:hypothetical protein
MIYIILGLSLILYGARIIIDPEYFDSKHGMYFNFSGIECPFGSLLIVLGLCFIFSELRKRRKRKSNGEN